jgi:predicted N-acetyltransferase YhbS
LPALLAQLNVPAGTMILRRWLFEKPLIITFRSASIAGQERRSGHADDMQAMRKLTAKTLAADARAAAQAAVARRWQAIDALLPEPSEPAVACGADLTVTSSDGQVVAVGSCRHLSLKPGTLELAWGAASQFALTPWVVGPDVGTALGQLVVRWRRHLARQHEAADPDSAAVIRWPSRDIDGVRALLEHGLRPLTVIAARSAGRRSPAATAGSASAGGAVCAEPVRLRVRAAEPGDVAAVERLVMAMMRYDAHFGAVQVRPDTAAAARDFAARTLAAANPWLWLAERDGTAVGMVQAEPPEAASWLAPAVRPQPVAYLGQMSVLPGERGTGVGTALVDHLHREIDALGVAVTLLHHAQLNPLSAPFWGSMGYRPLWTLWEVRPAVRLS